MTLVIARIVLRYLAGALVTLGYIERQLGAEIATDPDLLMLVGAGIGVIVEAGYAFAKRRGGAT
jgi:hypothetical protein